MQVARYMVWRVRNLPRDLKKQYHSKMVSLIEKKHWISLIKHQICFQLEKEEYHRLLQNAVRTTYKKYGKEKEGKLNCEWIKYTKEANILDKIQVNGTVNSFITLKVHEVNFLNHPTTRIVNPAKNEVGRISKRILDQIKCKLCEILRVTEWKNLANVINAVWKK